jgi:hypothetical protein
MKIRNLFTAGTMNKDLDERLVPNGSFKDALNLRVSSSAGSDVGAAENTLSNKPVTTLSLGDNPKAIGMVSDNMDSTMYWCVVSDSGCFVCEFNSSSVQSEIILSDNRVDNLLGFKANRFVDMSVINDAENGKKFLILTDGFSEPKYFNISDAKALLNNSFDLADIMLIKAPPLYAPTFELVETNDGENNIKDKFYSFSYRYVYSNNETSALSPFSEFAFFPGEFRYDYNSGNNKSMFNNKNKVDVTVNTGGSNVKTLEIVVKESDTNNYFIVEKINKLDKSLDNDVSYLFSFINNKVFRVLDAAQTLRVYDNVPITAKVVDVIGNRLLFGNYGDGYNLTNGSDTVVPNFSLSRSASTGVSGVSHKSIKSNTDYEVGISYLDGKGRMTTPLTSQGNTVHVPIFDSNKKNTLSVSLASKAPDWAKKYRFFVKQSRNDYDVISPVSFYKEGIYAWIKIEGEDINKVKKGDFLFIKSDTSGIKRTQTRVKVLDAENKDRNFLENSLEVNTKQEGGNYIKISTEEISLNETSISTFDYSGYAFRSDATGNDFEGNQSYVDSPVFYGSGTNNLSVSGAFSGVTDYRYEVKILASEKYKWRKTNTETNLVGAWEDNGGIGYNTSSSLSLGDGISILFGSSSGHDVDDRWTINAKSLIRANTWDKGGAVDNYGRNAIMLLKCKNSSTESIRAGAIITLEYDDSRSEDSDNIGGYIFQRFIASNNYENMEEWFWEDDVISKMTEPENAGEIMFRRGALAKTNGENMTINPSGGLFMCILSPANYTGGGKVRVDLDIRVLELDNPIIFETDYKNTDSEAFYEMPYTYNIDDYGNHLGDTDQDFGVTSAVVNLPYFNCFGWYNGYESIKIGDAFNEKKMLNDSKPLVPIDDYRQIKRVAGLTYGEVYEASTSYNGLNEFNLSRANYKDLDINFGSIERVISMDGDVVVIQNNRVSRILFSKNVLYNADGSGNLQASSNVLGQDVPYVGDYGILKNPYSATVKNNNIYFLDEIRRAVVRIATNGMFPISNYGMKDWFNDNVNIDSRVVSSFDPQNNQYVLGITEPVVDWRADTFYCVQEGDPAPTTDAPTTDAPTTDAPTTDAPASCECITVDVLNTQLTSGGLDLYYILNQCGVGSTSINLTNTLGSEFDGSTYFGLCNTGSQSNLFKYGPSGSPFVGIEGMNVTPNLTTCTVNGDCVPVTPTTSTTSTTAAPTTAAPTTDAPTTDAPTTDAPTTDAPTTDAPTTDAPTTDAPTTDAPTTDAPTTDAPTTDAPTTDAPGTCRNVFVENTVDSNRYGARWINPVNGNTQTIFSNLFGVETNIGGNDGVVYSLCASSLSLTWDSNTNTIVTISGVTELAEGSSCTEDSSCSYAAPTTAAPTTAAPTTDAPTTDAPTTDAPTTDAPTTDAPTTDAPTTDAPTTDAPVTGYDSTQEVGEPNKCSAAILSEVYYHNGPSAAPEVGVRCYSDSNATIPLTAGFYQITGTQYLQINNNDGEVILLGTCP